MSSKIKKIDVYGSGCPTCKQLFETTKKIVADLSLDVEMEYIDDVAKLIELGVMTSPALVVDGCPVLTGSGHSDDEIKEAIVSSKDEKESGECSSCSCEGESCC